MYEKSEFAFNDIIDDIIHNRHGRFLINQGLFHGCPVVGHVDSLMLTGVLNIVNYNEFYIEQYCKNGVGPIESLKLDKNSMCWQFSIFYPRALSYSFSAGVGVVLDIDRLLKFAAQNKVYIKCLFDQDAYICTLVHEDINVAYISKISCNNAVANVYLSLIKILNIRNPKLANVLKYKAWTYGR